jgi:hypothetical protein
MRLPALLLAMGLVHVQTGTMREKLSSDYRASLATQATIADRECGGFDCGKRFFALSDFGTDRDAPCILSLRSPEE